MADLSVPQGCEQCGEPCADGVKPCPWSGLLLCAECKYDEGIQAEERHLANVDGEDSDG